MVNMDITNKHVYHILIKQKVITKQLTSQITSQVITQIMNRAMKSHFLGVISIVLISILNR